LNPVRIALLDSGVDDSLKESVSMSRASLQMKHEGVIEKVAITDKLGHGSALARVIISMAPTSRLLVAQLFRQKLLCTPVQVAAALDWVVSEGAQLVNMSFGLSHDRPVLREACERARAAEVILVAASPARGRPAFPASYPGVIRATGDARCRAGEISFLDSPQADFGGCVQSSDTVVAGASVGCAHVTAKIASGLSSGLIAGSRDARQWLARQARFQGPERRS